MVTNATLTAINDRLNLAITALTTAGATTEAAAVQAITPVTRQTLDTASAAMFSLEANLRAQWTPSWDPFVEAAYPRVASTLNFGAVSWSALAVDEPRLFSVAKMVLRAGVMVDCRRLAGG